MKKIIDLLLIIAVFAALCSCEGMMDVHKKYLEGGEIVYMPVPESVEFFAGRERVVLRIVLYNSPNAKSIDIYWNNEADSLIYPVTPSTGRDTIEIEIPNLEEKSYTFTVWTSDAYGSRSLPTTGFSGAYGDMFQSSLLNQPVWRVALTEEGGLITWSSIIEHLVATEVRYTDKNDETHIISSPATGSNVLCPDVKTSSRFAYRSLFLPEAGAVDTFYVDWTEYATPFPEMLQLDKSGFRVIAVSSEASDGGGMHAIIDNKLETFWHSAYVGGMAPFPHWIIVDLGSPKKICRIETYRRIDYGVDAKTVQFAVGDDPTYNAPTWKDIGEVVFSTISGDNLRTLDIPDSVDTDGRCLRIWLPDNNGRQTYNSIAEIYIYVN